MSKIRNRMLPGYKGWPVLMVARCNITITNKKYVDVRGVSNSLSFVMVLFNYIIIYEI